MAGLMDSKGADTTYGRGNMAAGNGAGAGKMKDPTSGHDARDKVKATGIEAVRLTPPVRAGRGNHDKSLLGG